MVLSKDTAKKTAELLLQINAIKLNPENPFSWASGWKSPIYCDNRIILSHPSIRNYVREEMAKQVELLYGKPDVIAGVATGAIGIGMLVADYLGLPFIYVRPEAKSHGRQNQIEGSLEENQTVVATENFKQVNLELHTLSDYDNLIQQASETNYIKEEQFKTLLEWKINPSDWQP